MIRKQLTIQGHVQGVCFRSNTRQKAQQLGLKGWVRNCANGEVACVAEGEEIQILQLLDWMRSHPGEARVEAIREQTEAATGEYSDFIILPT
ncbi:MAG TPA: acylphosphatase [bacterium]|nr:acylphosphatase [bacterium]